MPPVVVTFVGFPVMLVLLVGVHLLARNVLRRALGVTETTALSWQRLLAHTVGLVASYLTCALVFFVALLGSGWDENTLRVKVTPSGPAYEAGLRDGDSVVAMNGVHPAVWEELRTMIADNPGRSIDFQVKRGAQTRHFQVQPRDGRIGVASIVEHHQSPPDRAAVGATASPVIAITGAIADMVRRLTKPVMLMGPVAINTRDPSPWPLFFRLGQLGSYAWPVSIVIAFVVSRRRSRITR